LINQSITRLINQIINQSINQSIDQPINQSIDQLVLYPPSTAKTKNDMNGACFAYVGIYYFLSRSQPNFLHSRQQKYFSLHFEDFAKLQKNATTICFKTPQLTEKALCVGFLFINPILPFSFFLSFSHWDLHMNQTAHNLKSFAQFSTKLQRKCLGSIL
jgi:hypothetical protein